jgi:CMP-N-acetylneuraminic acid synthetase
MMARAVALAHGSVRSREIWRIVVSTESDSYARLARRAGAEVVTRPQRLATSGARLADVILHALDRCGPEFDAVLMLSAATPLTEPRDVRRAVALVKKHGGSAVSVTREAFPTSWRFSVDRGCLVVPRGTRVGRRQQAALQYRLNGAVFMTSPARLRRYGQFVAPRDTRAVIMPRERSVDVEDKFDLDWARFLWAGRVRDRDQRI